MTLQGKNIFTLVNTKEEYNQVISANSSKLLLFDVYNTWAGQCEVVEPVLRKLFQKMDGLNERLQCFAVC